MKIFGRDTSKASAVYLRGDANRAAGKVVKSAGLKAVRRGEISTRQPRDGRGQVQATNAERN